MAFRLFCLLALGFLPFIAVRAQDRLPNIVVIFADDLGYGDLGVYGNPTIRTPELDRMATEGMKFTQFYAGASVCTPSRAALLTGRLPVRSGLMGKRRVLFPDSAGGLQADEITLAEALKTRGYRTAAIGKWHLGHLPQYLPTRNGFDYYFGIPYSNDMNRKEVGEPPVPLMRNEEIIEQPVDQTTLTKRYTEEALRFIRENQDHPFFLYLPHTFPHVPLYASDDFLGKSKRGLYGDAVEEMDWSVGQVLKALDELGLAEHTFVFFTSDNGPWLTQNLNGGSAGLLRDGKGSTWEGGMRVPAIAWWPGTVPAGKVSPSLGTTMDLFSTSLALAGVEAPGDRAIDGFDLTPILLGGEDEVRDAVFYYRVGTLWAVRKGPWKAHFRTRSGYGNVSAIDHDPPALYNLDYDPGEQYDVAEEHPEIIEEIKTLAATHLAGVIPVQDQTTAIIE